MDAKKNLLEILDYYKQRIKTDSCTMAEMNSALKALEENMKVSGTISDFAKFYDQKEQNVRTVISRKLIDKPQRKVLYPFHAFRKVVPDKWLKDK